MSEPLEKRELLVKSPSGDKRYGSFVIGIPVKTVLELKQKYPDHEFRGGDPRVDEAIKQALTENEKLQIGNYLGVSSDTDFKFEFQAIARSIDEAEKLARFESNGKKFWIFPRPKRNFQPRVPARKGEETGEREVLGCTQQQDKVIQREEVVERPGRTLDKEDSLKSFCKAVLAWSDSECQILVFGSSEQYRSFSDIDVAVISEKFKDQGWQQRIAKLVEFISEKSVLIKPIGITPDEKTMFDYPSIIRTVRNGPTRDITVWI